MSNKTTPEQTSLPKIRQGAAYAAHQAKMIDQAKRNAGLDVPPRTAPPTEDEAGNPLRLGCARTNCQVSHDVSQYKTQAQRDAFAAASGFVNYNGDLFCGKTCVTLHMGAPDGGGKAKPLVFAKAVDIAPKRITVTNGAVHCDYAVCESKFQTDAADEARLLGTAAANGWVETKDGVFCGGGCAKRARADIAAGIQPARTYADAVAEVVGSVPAGEVGR